MNEHEMNEEGRKCKDDGPFSVPNPSSIAFQPSLSFLFLVHFKAGEGEDNLVES